MKFINFDRWRKKERPNAILELKRVGIIFADILKHIAEHRALIDSWEQIIFNAEVGEKIPSILEHGKKRGMAEVYHKKGRALVIALTLYRILLLEIDGLIPNNGGFVAEKPAFVARIQPLNSKLAKAIELLQSSSIENLGILEPLRSSLKNPQLAISFIKTHYDDVIQKIDRMKDQNRASKLRRIVVILSNRELDELTRCIKDVRSWPYRVDNDRRAAAYGVPPVVYSIVERSFLFINGGKSKYDGEAFWGFNMHFRDEKLVSELRSTPEIRKLMAYVEELKFFIEARNAIKRSVETQGKWEGFYEFYNNLNKGKDYIGMFRNKFGNEKFAKIREALKEKKHEVPVEWEEELSTLGEEMRQSYRFVIGSAETAFLRIFDIATKRLEAEKRTAMSDLIKLMSQSGEMAKIKRKFLKILARERKKLITELKEEQHKLMMVVGSSFTKMPELVALFYEIISKADFDYELLAEFGALDALAKEQSSALQGAQILKAGEGAFENDDAVRQLTRTIASLHYSSEHASNERKIKQTVERKSEESLIILHQLIEMAQNMLPNIREYIGYINKRLTENYIQEVNFVINQNRINAQQQDQRNKVVNMADWKGENTVNILPAQNQEGRVNNQETQQNVVSMDEWKTERSNTNKRDKNADLRKSA